MHIVHSERMCSLVRIQIEDNFVNITRKPLQHDRKLIYFPVWLYFFGRRYRKKAAHRHYYFCSGA